MMDGNLPPSGGARTGLPAAGAPDDDTVVTTTRGESVEMELVIQTMSYINYELLIEWSWQWDLVTSLVTSQRHSGFPGGGRSTHPHQEPLNG